MKIWQDNKKSQLLFIKYGKNLLGKFFLIQKPRYSHLTSIYCVLQIGPYLNFVILSGITFAVYGRQLKESQVKWLVEKWDNREAAEEINLKFSDITSINSQYLK